LIVSTSEEPVPVAHASAFRRTVWPAAPTARLNCVPAGINAFWFALSTVTASVCARDRPGDVDFTAVVVVGLLRVLAALGERERRKDTGGEERAHDHQLQLHQSSRK